MKNSGFVLSVWLGMTLSALGCGPADPGEREVLGRSEQAMSSGDMHQSAVPMSLAQFQSAADPLGRCGVDAQVCVEELDYGYSRGLLTYDAYVWGLRNGYYPVISRVDVIQAVCKCLGPMPHPTLW